MRHRARRRHDRRSVAGGGNERLTHNQLNVLLLPTEIDVLGTAVALDLQNDVGGRTLLGDGDGRQVLALPGWLRLVRGDVDALAALPPFQAAFEDLAQTGRLLAVVEALEVVLFLTLAEGSRDQRGRQARAAGDVGVLVGADGLAGLARL